VDDNILKLAAQFRHPGTQAVVSSWETQLSGGGTARQDPKICLRMLLCKVLYREGFKDGLGKPSGVVYSEIIMQAGRSEVCVNHADGSIASSSQDHSRADTNRSTPRITLHCGKQDDLG